MDPKLKGSVPGVEFVSGLKIGDGNYDATTCALEAMSHSFTVRNIFYENREISYLTLIRIAKVENDLVVLEG